MLFQKNSYFFVRRRTAVSALSLCPCTLRLIETPRCELCDVWLVMSILDHKYNLNNCLHAFNQNGDRKAIYFKIKMEKARMHEAQDQSTSAESNVRVLLI